MGTFFFGWSCVPLCFQCTGILCHLRFLIQEITELENLYQEMLLATIRSNSHYEYYHAIRSLPALPYYWTPLRHFLAVVFPVVAIRSSLVHGALLVFLLPDSDAANYAGLA